jgi:hypothetical protein
MFFIVQTRQYKTINIKTMKTKTNISPLARTGLAALAVLLASAAYPVRAAQDADPESERKCKAAAKLEVSEAMDRLEAMNNAIEKSVTYIMPAENEDITAYEARVAAERLDNLALCAQESVRYEASMANEEADPIEVALAKERLENLYLAVEQQIKFNTPDRLDQVNLQDKLEYVSNGDYTIPLEVASGELVSAR